MPWRFVVPGWLMAVLVGACASSSPSERPVGPPPEALFPSPLALLLEHHTELQLTTEQLIELDRRETALQEKNRPLREKLRQGPGRGPEQGELPPPPPGGMTGVPGDPTGMGGHGGMGGMAGRLGGPSGNMGGMGGGHRRDDSPMSEDARKQQQAALREIEDNESAAYNDAEALLNETQKAKARELISQQREERMRIRESMKGRVAPPEP